MMASITPMYLNFSIVLKNPPPLSPINVTIIKLLFYAHVVHLYMLSLKGNIGTPGFMYSIKNIGNITCVPVSMYSFTLAYYVSVHLNMLLCAHL